MILDYQHLSEKLKQPLPGSLAHEPLRAVPIGLIKPRFDHGTAPKSGGVMILLYEDLFLKNYKIPDILSYFHIENETFVRLFFQIAFESKGQIYR